MPKKLIKTTTDNFQLYDQELKEAIASGAFQTADADPNSYFYHYTSLSVLMSIINNDELWATDAMFLNDEEEFRYVLEILQTALELKFGYENAGCIRFRKGLKKYTGNSEEIMKELFGNSYVLCFSTQRDNLTLWSEFANQGCNLEINFWSILESLVDKGLNNFSHNRVIYDAQTQCDMLEEVITDVLELFFEDGKDGNVHAKSSVWKQIEDLDAESFDLLISSCMALVRYKGMFFKRPEFYAEQEYRLIIHSKNPTQRNHLPIKGMLRPYLKIPVEMNKNALKSVTLAPYNAEIAARSVEDYIRLTEKVKEVSVRKSVIRLRY